MEFSIDTIASLVSLIAAIIGLAGGVCHIYRKLKKAKEQMKSFVAAMKHLMALFKEANADGKITDEEYTKLVEEANDTMKKGSKLLKTSEDILKDIAKLRGQVLIIVESRKVNGDVEAAIDETTPDAEKEKEAEANDEKDEEKEPEKPEDKKASTPEPPLPPKAKKVETTEKDEPKTKIPKDELDKMMDDIDGKLRP